MPTAWSDKDERQYEHIKESTMERGTSEPKAEEISRLAARKRLTRFYAERGRPTRLAAEGHR